MELLKQKIKPVQQYLEQFQDILTRWQKAVNLISEKDETKIWERHILDSAQVYFLIPQSAKILVDFGSGGGFPALIIALLNKHLNGCLEKIILVESDNKKCIFLQEAARELSLPVQILNERIENVSNIKADVITARGFSTLKNIIRLGIPFIKKETIFLLSKGEKAHNEIKEVDIKSCFQLIPSVIQKNSFIVKVSEVKTK